MISHKYLGSWLDCGSSLQLEDHKTGVIKYLPRDWWLSDVTSQPITVHHHTPLEVLPRYEPEVGIFQVRAEFVTRKEE